MENKQESAPELLGQEIVIEDVSATTAPEIIIPEIQINDGQNTAQSEVIIPEIFEPENLDSSIIHEPIENYPKTLEANTGYRLKVLLKSVNNRELQALMKSMCKDDILFWINCFCATYNPRKTPSVIPFLTYKYEDELILDLVERVRNQKDILVDKSRDMGVTWCVLIVLTWFWQFHGEGQDFLVGSRKEQYIDVVGNMDTLIEKVRFLIRNQPKWLLPKGFRWEKDSNYMKIINPESKSTITGEATNENFSRGGRRRAIFFDEFAFWDVDESAWRASADSTNCRIVVSTPCGFNNQFGKLRHSGSIDVRSLHWKLHPEKDQAWYENECKRRNNDAVEIAQELDINYEGSDEGVLFPFDELKSAVHNQPIMSKDRIVVSLDPSGQGEDEAPFYVGNNGNIIARKIIKGKTSDTELGAEAVALITKYSAQVFICDAIGNGVIAMVTTLLGKNDRGVKIVAFDSRLKAKNPVKYYNRRDEVYGEAAEKLKSGNVAVDDDYTLMRQLNAHKYKKDNGRMYIISKEEVKAIINSSPDRADSWVLNIEGLSYTHSRMEVEQKERYRQRINYGEVSSGDEYGSWGDQL